MADVELVIKIDKRTYDDLVKYNVLNYTNTSEIIEKIKNGTPLPKGHGRLIDVSALLMDFAFANNKSAGECVHDAHTIINADKESD